jgi:uncharacterized protein (DUF2062 family)
MNGEFQHDSIVLLKSINKKLDRINTSPSLARSFFVGLVGGFAAVLGATVVIAIMIAVLQQFITVPVVGEYIKQIIEVVQRK